MARLRPLPGPNRNAIGGWIELRSGSRTYRRELTDGQATTMLQLSSEPAGVFTIDGLALEVLREDELVVIATYTAMLSLRSALAGLGFVGQFWED